YIASSTFSNNFPALNAFQPNLRGGNDAIICKLNSDLSGLHWSSYLGGSNIDAAYSIQLDNSHVYVCGGTNSSDLQHTSGSFKAFNSGSTDGFVAKLSKSGNIVRTTYIGTPNYDQTYFVQLDVNSNVYLLGQTLGNYPVSAGVYFNANGRQFIQKLNSDLTQPVFSTIFGANGNINISPTAFLVDDCERILIAGWGGNTSNSLIGGLISNTNNLPTTPGAFQRTTDGSDFYLIQLDANATNLAYATFLGGTSMRGEHVDGGTSRFDKRGIVYQAVCGGCGGSSAFPTTPGAWSRTNRSTNCNNAAFKFDFEIARANPGVDQTVCANAAPFVLPGFSPPGGTWSGNGVAPNGLFTPSKSLVGVQQLTYTYTQGACVSSGTINLTVNASPEIDFTGLDSSYCTSDSVAFTVPLTGVPAGGTFTGKGIINGNIFDPLVAGPGKHTITYTFTTPEGCTSSISKTTLIQLPDVHIQPHQLVCTESNSNVVSAIAPFTVDFTNTTSGAKSFYWDFGDGTYSTEQSPQHTYVNEGTYKVIVLVDFGNGCVKEREIGTYHVVPLQLPNIFTPNNDGINDLFEVNLNCPPLKFKVFNRWGAKVFEDNNYQNKWNGDELADGVYYYHFTNQLGQTWKGWFEIVR
ncbi:MAG: gliding motility-associated C-terminal domain-containing protein, partial [Hymenobacteraceae bacterium]|nr:gliding motility-associated C-terminal domain-containing protein [Hymenobacteraceae bacterium]